MYNKKQSFFDATSKEKNFITRSNSIYKYEKTNQTFCFL